jgi:hypothetical protein
MNRIDHIREVISQKGLKGEVTETQLLDVLRSLPSRPSLGAPAHADDSHDPGMELMTLTTEQRKALGLTVRTSPVRALSKTRQAVEPESVSPADQQLQVQALGPVLRVHVQALACRNDNGLLSNGSAGQSRQELGEAIARAVAYANEIFHGTNIELFFNPAADLEIRNDTRLNQDFVIPASEQGKLTQQPPLTEAEVDALCNKNSTTTYRNDVARKYQGKMVLLFAEGTTRFFNTSNQHWVISSPSGGGFSWEDLEFVKLSAGVGNSDVEAEGYATFMSHEVGHYLHLWHPFYQISLTGAENGNPALTDQQKVDILTQRVTDVLNRELANGVPADKVVKILDADAAVVSDTPPDDSGELLHYLNRVANGGDACGLLGEVKLTLKNGSPASYKPDRSLVMSYFKGCLNFNQHFSSSQAQRMRNALVNGNRKHTVIVNTPERFNAIWHKSTEGQPAVWGWARADFDKRQAELQAQGYRLEELNAFVLPNGQGERFNAIWCKSTEERPAVWGWARADFDKRQAELQAQGYRLEELNAFVLPNGQGERFNAIWRKTTEERPAVWGWARADFDKRQAELQAQGYRLEELNAFVLPNGQGERFNAIWRKTTEERPAVWGWARADFDKRQAELQAQGYRLEELNAFVLPNGQGERFNAIWRKTTEERPAVWGWARVDFDKRQAELQAQGYTLVGLNAFVL